MGRLSVKRWESYNLLIGQLLLKAGFKEARNEKLGASEKNKL